MPKIDRGLLTDQQPDRRGYRVPTGLDNIGLSSIGQHSMTSPMSDGTIEDQSRLDALKGQNASDVPQGALVTRAVEQSSGGSGGDTTFNANISQSSRDRYFEMKARQAEMAMGDFGTTATPTGAVWTNMPEDWSPDTPYIPPPATYTPSSRILYVDPGKRRYGGPQE